MSVFLIASAWSTVLPFSHSVARLELAIADRGPSVPGPVREGHGLTGMRERVQLYGGSMETGPLDDGGFGVRVVLPVGSVPGSAS